uniref:Tetraspanin n=1 Tax=Chrysemys picta bellii TaxID=8478 RepID=A0A8C3FCH3_CHRPI
MVGLGLWIKLGSASFVRVLGATSVYFAHVGYFCIVAGSMVVVLGFMGCWGAVKENRCLLLTYFLIMLVIFIAEIAAAVVVFAFTSFVSIQNSLLMWEILIFLDKVSPRSYKEESLGIGSFFQTGRNFKREVKWPTFLNCCGVHNYTDFSGSAFQIRTNLTYPKSCCKDPTSSACNGRNVSSVVINQEVTARFGGRKGNCGNSAVKNLLLAMMVSLMLYAKLE